MAVHVLRNIRYALDILENTVLSIFRNQYPQREYSIVSIGYIVLRILIMYCNSNIYIFFIL